MVCSVVIFVFVKNAYVFDYIVTAFDVDAFTWHYTVLENLNIHIGGFVLQDS